MATKEEAIKKAQVAEKKVEEAVSTLENSKVVKKIPLKIHGLELSDLIVISLILKIGFFIPAYLIVSLAGEPRLTVGAWIITFFKTIYIFVGIFDLLFEIIVYLGNIKSMLGLAWISAIAKNIVVNTVLLAYVGYEMRLFVFMNYSLFAAIMIVLDMGFLYYLGVSLRHDEDNDNEDEKV